MKTLLILSYKRNILGRSTF